MNLLNFINKSDLNSLDRNPFMYIDLHTKNLNKAKKQCDEFFASHNADFYYTNASDYQYYGGWCYELHPSFCGNYWLILQNDEYIEI